MLDLRGGKVVWKICIYCFVLSSVLCVKVKIGLFWVWDSEGGSCESVACKRGASGAKLLDGRKASERWNKELKQAAREVAEKLGREPSLSVVVVGNRADSLLYVEKKEEACCEVSFGIVLDVVHLSAVFVECSCDCDLLWLDHVCEAFVFRFDISNWSVETECRKWAVPAQNIHVLKGVSFKHRKWCE